MTSGSDSDKKMDVYSFSFIMYFIFTGKLPYNDGQESTNSISLNQEIEKGSHSCPKVIGEMMRSCWDANPRSRPSFETIHKFFRDYRKPEEDPIEEARKEEEQRRKRAGCMHSKII